MEQAKHQTKFKWNKQNFNKNTRHDLQLAGCDRKGLKSVAF